MVERETCVEASAPCAPGCSGERGPAGGPMARKKRVSGIRKRRDKSAVDKFLGTHMLYYTKGKYKGKQREEA